jgi:hypothetical protein
MLSRKITHLWDFVLQPIQWKRGYCTDTHDGICSQVSYNSCMRPELKASVVDETIKIEANGCPDHVHTPSPNRTLSCTLHFMQHRATQKCRAE